jgi:8-oxo-dGTP pyrophosphatase MutT (NUDIX family)
MVNENINKQQNIITSYGIALTKKNKLLDCYELLYIKKRVTYAYITFIKGIYNKNNDNELIRLFNNMTIEEKICIMSLNFNIMWHKLYLMHPYNRIILKDLQKFENSKNKFEKRFLYDEGKRLLKLIKNTKSVHKLWEIPKGMINKNESHINAAIREFNEETNIKKNKYKILYNVKPLIYIFEDDNITYKYVYYLAIMLDSKYIPNVELNVNSQSLMESIDIKFLNINEISLINKDKKYIDFVKKIFKLAKTYVM